MSDTTNHDLLFKSENHTNELADGELDERDLEGINGAGWVDDRINDVANGARAVGKFIGDVSQTPRKLGNALGEGFRQGQRD
jgi:hypothetical protein